MNQPNPYIITICSQLETRLGFKIKNIASSQKCSEILAIEKLYISQHTIARLFGAVKPYRTPYKDTLNIIARYLNYSDWEDFCNNQTNVPFDPNYFLAEASDGFSLAVLQLALANEDFKALQHVLEKATYNENDAILFSAAELIGSYVRKSKKQKELLELLANSSVGHLFFYECYVDEDNEAQYFSEALVKHYLAKVSNDYKKLYVYCYLISQSAHKEQKESIYFDDFTELTNKLDKTKCHFHERSRWLECLILIDGFNNELQNTWEQKVQDVIESTIGQGLNEKAWLLSRSLKAMVLFGLREELFNCKEWNDVIDHLIKNQNKEIHSVALYVIQLYWITKSIYFKSKTIYTPFRIHNILFQNESNEKLAIEFGVASLFATGKNKSIITRNLKNFCETKGIHWVEKMIS